MKLARTGKGEKRTTKPNGGNSRPIFDVGADSQGRRRRKREIITSAKWVEEVGKKSVPSHLFVAIMTPALIQRLMRTNEFSSTFDSITDKPNCYNYAKCLTRHRSESQRERSNQHSKQELSLVQSAAMVEKRGSRLLTVRLQGRPCFFPLKSHQERTCFSFSRQLLEAALPRKCVHENGLPCGIIESAPLNRIMQEVSPERASQ